jgi:peptide/nickel transport system substrate-binding protein
MATQPKKRRTTSRGSDSLRFSEKPKRAVPTAAQWRYLPQILDRHERIILFVTACLLLIGAATLSIRWYYINSIDQPAVGGSYSEALVGTPKHINPILSPLSDANTDADISSLVFSSIFTYDENRELIPDLITNYTQDNNTTYTFYMRYGVKWHDGEELTADDIGFTIDAIQDAQYGSPLKASLRKVQFTKIDDYSFTLTLPEPYAPFLASLTFGIVPEHIWNNVPPQNVGTTDLNLAPLGSGPYAFDSLVKDRDGNIKSMLLTRHEDYYREAPYIEELTFVFESDVFAAANELLTGGVDGMSFLPQNLVDEARNNPDLVLHDLRIPQYSAVYFNQEQSDVLADDDVRTALAHAMNSEEIIDTVLGGEGEKIYGPILPGYVGYHPEIKKYEHSVDTAQQVLETDKWTVPKKQPELTATEKEGVQVLPAPETQVRVQNKKPLEFTLATADLPEYQRSAELLQRQWAAIGASVTVELYAPEAMQSSVISTRDYDAILFSTIIGNDADPYPFWHSSNQSDPGLALAIYSDLDSDKLLEDGRQTINEEERQKKYVEFQNILADEIPALFLYQPRRMYAIDKKVQGVKNNQYISIPAHRFASITDWYIEFERQRK